VKKISNALEIEALQNKKLISTAATFCATKTTARVERTSNSANLTFIFQLPLGRGKTSDVAGDLAGITCKNLT
jgi:hypothetical protein